MSRLKTIHKARADLSVLTLRRFVGYDGPSVISRDPSSLRAILPSAMAEYLHPARKIFLCSGVRGSSGTGRYDVDKIRLAVATLRRLTGDHNEA